MEIEKPVRVSLGFANLRIERHCITSDTILITSPYAVKPYAKKKIPAIIRGIPAIKPQTIPAHLFIAGFLWRRFFFHY
jgi:hypothetical protein